MTGLRINLESNDTVLYTDVSGVPQEVLRVTQAGIVSVPALSGRGLVPPGAIVALVPGFFAGSNSGFVPVGMSDDLAGVNAALAATGWKVCDGSLITDPTSPFVGRVTQPLTDDRFLAGGTSTAFAGSNTLPNHTHGLSVLTSSDLGHSHSHSLCLPMSHTHAASAMCNFGVSDFSGSHCHAYSVSSTSGTVIDQFDDGSGWGIKLCTVSLYSSTLHCHALGSPSISATLGETTRSFTGTVAANGTTTPDGTHAHTLSGALGTGLANPDSRPKYLRCFMIMRIK